MTTKRFLLSNKLKEAITLGAVIFGLFYIYGEYRTDQNQSLPSNYYSLWLSYDRNITQVKDLDMNLDYVKKSFEFTSHFIPSSQNVVFDVEASRFNQENSCDIFLQEVDSNGTPKQVWSVANVKLTRLTLKNDPRDTILFLRGTCSLDSPKPNGFLQAEISNQTKPVPIGNSTLNLSFDDSKFGCRENCLYNDQLHNVDEDSSGGIHTVVMKGENIADAHNMQFSLRTFDKEKANMVEVWFALFIGLIFFAFQIGYDIYKEVSISALIQKLYRRIKSKK